MAKVFFVPYDPTGRERNSTYLRDPDRHRHVALEYYRQIKSRRTAEQDRHLATKAVIRPKPPKSAPAGADKSTDNFEGDDATDRGSEPYGANLRDMINRKALMAHGASTIRPFSLNSIRSNDPFSSFCEPASHKFTLEMFDHSVTYQWSAFRLSTQQEGLDLLGKEITQAMMSSPVAWHANLYGGATHNAYRYAGVTHAKNDKQVRLYHKHRAIKALIDEMSKNNGQVSDATLIGMVTLAAHGSGETLRMKKTIPTRRPYLFTAQDTDYYSTNETGWEHLHALQEIVKRRGGLQTIRLQTLQVALQMYDIFVAFIRLRPLCFDLVNSTNTAIAMRTHQQDATATQLLLTLTSAYDRVSAQQEGLSDLVIVVKNAAIVTVDCDQSVRMRSQQKRSSGQTPDIVLLSYTRWLIIHDLLSIRETDLTAPLTAYDTIREALRLSLHAYSLFVLMPVPSENTKLPQILAQKLLSVLRAFALHDLHRQYSELFLCLIVWAGMCGLSISETSLREDCLLQTLPYLCNASVRIRDHVWPVVSATMRTFLWLDADCEAPGKACWRYFCQAELDAESMPSLLT